MAFGCGGALNVSAATLGKQELEFNEDLNWLIRIERTKVPAQEVELCAVPLSLEWYVHE